MSDIRHHTAARRFSTVIDGLEADVEYELAGDRMTITHTRVPDAIGGRGIAGELNRPAFEHARAHGLKVQPQCPYTAAWVERHPEYNHLLG